MAVPKQNAQIRAGDTPKKPEDPRPPGPTLPPVGDPANLPPVIQKKLDKMGLKVVFTDGGWALVGDTRGTGTDVQLALAQRLANQFGVLRNDWFDPTRAVYHGGNMYELGAGSGLNHGGSTNVLSDTELANARARAGWTVEDAYQQAMDALPAWERNMNGGKGPSSMWTLEAYQASLTGARENYTNPEQPVDPNAAPPSPYTPYTDFHSSPSSAYAAPAAQNFNSIESLGAAREYHAYNYASSLATGDPAKVDAAITGLEQHSRFMQTWDALQPPQVTRPLQSVDHFSTDQVQNR